MQTTQEPKLTQYRKRSLLFINYVSSDGFGDLGHLIDITEPSVLRKINDNHPLGRLESFTPLYVICCSNATPDRLRFIVNSLEEHGLVRVGKSKYDKNDQIEQYVQELLENNPTVFICTDDEDERPLVKTVTTLMNDSQFQKSVNEASAAYKISCPTKLFDRLIDTKLFMCSELLEHSINNSTNRFHQYMGFNDTGVILHPTKNSTNEEKAKALLSLQNKEYLLTLLDQTEQKSLTPAVAKKFIEENLVVPGYFQDPIANALFVNCCTLSEASQKYATVIFHVNGKEFNQDLLALDALAKSGVAKIIVYSPDKKPESQLLQAATGNRTVKILKDFWLISEDYENLFKAAQLFGGCSGDKTLELALATRQIPFYAERQWKQGLSSELASLVETIDPSMDIFSLHVQTYINFFSKMRDIDEIDIEQESVALAEVMHEGFIERWQELIKLIHLKFNFMDKLPTVLLVPILVNDLIAAIKIKNELAASKLLEFFNKGELTEITKWAEKHQLMELVNYIQYYIENLQESKSNPKYHP